MKKMKIRILMFIMAILMLVLVGCGKEKTNDTTNDNLNTTVNDFEKQEKPDDIIEYSGDVSGEVIVEDDFTAFKKNIQDELNEFAAIPYTMNIFFKDKEGATYEEFGLSSLIADLKGKEDVFDSLSYALKDLNNDGKDELLIFNNELEDKNIIVSMYSMKELDESDELEGIVPMNIFNSQTDMFFKLYDNNTIRLEVVLEEPAETVTNSSGEVVELEIVNYDFLQLDKDLEFKSLVTTEEGNIDVEKAKTLNKDLKEVVLEKTPILK